MLPWTGVPPRAWTSALLLIAGVGGLALAVRTIGLELGWSLEAASFAAALAVGSVVQMFQEQIGASRNTLDVAGCIPMVPGGFFGVEVFFVISGYLITALLLAEYRNRQHIALGQFYLRRARRLLPALFLMLAVVGLYSVLFLPDEVHTLRGDTFGALAYIQNWWQIYAGRSYFAQTGRPPLLQHLWSLAVEEQFYLIWPLLFAGLLRLWGRRPSRIVWTIVGGALASTALMWILFPGDPLRASRVYYGTDTRASGLLLGAALAMLWAPWRLTPRITAAGRAVLDLAGAVGLAVILIFLFEVPDDATWIYRGGFLLLGLATLLVIAATVHPGADVGRVLGVRPLVWVGLRSYSLYVWHWPIYQVTRPDLDVPLHGYALLALRLTLTVIVAELSYRFVETPIRQGALSRAWRAMREGAMAPATRQRATAVLAGSAVLLLVVGVGFAGAKEPPPPETRTADATPAPDPEPPLPLPPPPRPRRLNPSTGPRSATATCAQRWCCSRPGSS